MEELVKLLQQGHDYFGSGTRNSKEFNTFAKSFERQIIKDLTKLNATNIVVHKGHFELSGFFTVGYKVYYFSLSDVRWAIGEQYDQLLYRTAKGYSDYSGGVNQYVKLKDNWQEDLLLY